MSTFNQKTKECCVCLQVISAHVCKLLGITCTPRSSSSSVADPPRDVRALFLEKKSRTGEWADSLTYQQFLDGLHRLAWITTLKEQRKKGNGDMSLSVYITSCPLAMTLTIHSLSGSHVDSDIYTSHHMDAWVFKGFFLYISSHWNWKWRKYPLIDLTGEILVARMKWPSRSE